MNLEKLNAIGRAKEQRTVKALSELELDQLYLIENIRKANTKFGEKIIVDLENKIYCYLPARVGKELLANNEEGLIEFKEQLEVSNISMRRLKGRWNPVEFVITLPDDDDFSTLENDNVGSVVVNDYSQCDDVAGGSI